MSSRRARSGGELHANHVQAVVEVLAELAVFDVLLDVAVRRREHAHVDGDLLRRATASHLALLQHAQQRHLELGSQVGHLVEQHRATFGVAEDAEVALRRARERTFLVAEELALHEILGDGAAVDDQHRLVLAVAHLVDGARDALLAGPALARDEHGGLAAGHALREVEHSAYGRRVSDDARGARPRYLRTEAFVLRREGTSLEGLAGEGASSDVAKGLVTKS